MLEVRDARHSSASGDGAKRSFKPCFNLITISLRKIASVLPERYHHFSSHSLPLKECLCAFSCSGLHAKGERVNNFTVFHI